MSVHIEDFPNCCGISVLINLDEINYKTGMLIDHRSYGDKLAEISLEAFLNGREHQAAYLFVSVPNQSREAGALAKAFRKLKFVVTHKSLGKNPTTRNTLTLWIAKRTAKTQVG